MNLLQRRREMMRKGAKINLLQDPTSPHGYIPKPTQYNIGNWYISETLQEGERVRLYIEFDELDVNKNTIAAFNSSSSRAAILVNNVPITQSFSIDFDWVVYGANNHINIYLSPNNSAHSISSVKFIGLYRI